VESREDFDPFIQRSADAALEAGEMAMNVGGLPAGRSAIDSAEAYSATSSARRVEIAKDCRPAPDSVLSDAPAC
jgi:Tfp pilus assembly protein PilX